MDVTSGAALQQMCLWLMVYARVWRCLCVIGLVHAGLGAMCGFTHECVLLRTLQARPVSTSANGCMFLQTVDVQPYW